MFVTLAPTSTRASARRVRPSRSTSARTRSTANEFRSTLVGVRPAASTAEMSELTISRDAATSRMRWRRPFSSSTSSSGCRSRIACSTGIGSTSATWNASDLRSSGIGIHGRSSLADDHLLVGNADDDLLGAELHPSPKLPDGGGHGFAVDDFAVAHGTWWEGYLPEPLQCRLVFRPSDLSPARTPVVPMSRPTALRPDTAAPSVREVGPRWPS